MILLPGFLKARNRRNNMALVKDKCAFFSYNNKGMGNKRKKNYANLIDDLRDKFPILSDN
jgi:hypothetical protein